MTLIFFPLTYYFPGIIWVTKCFSSWYITISPNYFLVLGCKNADDIKSYNNNRALKAYNSSHYGMVHTHYVHDHSFQMAPSLNLSKVPMTPFRIMAIVAGFAAIFLVISAIRTTGPQQKLGVVFHHASGAFKVSHSFTCETSCC